jgi:peroxiredoxin (alkyl hydroperoxide reductase subunit C)
MFNTEDICELCNDEPAFFSNVKVGYPVPDFTLDGYFKGEKHKYSLSAYRGKWVILFFYPLDFTFVCPTEIKELSKNYQDFKDAETEVLGISVDSVFSHEAWSKGDLGDLEFPLLSDLTKEVSEDFGVLIEEEGIALRGVFTIDPDGILRAMTVNDNDVGRSTEEIYRVLCALQTGELCPINWNKGQKTIKGE